MLPHFAFSLDNDTKKIQKQYMLNTLHTRKLISLVNQPPLKVLKAYFNEKCASDLNSSSKFSILSGFRLKIKVNILKVSCWTIYFP